MKLVHGIHAMLVTPFTVDYKLNEEALRMEVRWALNNGADGIVVPMVRSNSLVTTLAAPSVTSNMTG